jgi:hypothetical protein
MSTLDTTIPESAVESSGLGGNNMTFLLLAAAVAVIAVLYLCRDTTPNITGLTVEQAKKKLKDTGYTVGDKVGFVEPIDGNQLGKIAEQEVDKQEKKIHYKMFQIDVNNIDEYARLAKEKAKQARQMAIMQAELEKAMRSAPIITPPPQEAPPPIVEEVVVAPPPPPVVEKKKKRVVDMGFGATGLSVKRTQRQTTEGFFW